MNIDPAKRNAWADYYEPIIREMYADVPDQIAAAVDGGGDRERQIAQEWVDKILAKAFHRIRHGRPN